MTGSKSLWLRLLRWLLTLSLLAALAVSVDRFLHRPPRVAVARAERGDVVRTLAVIGRLAPLSVNQVVSQVPGRVVELTLDEGARIERGEVLARIETAEADAAVSQAEAALRSARDELAQAQRDAARAVELFAQGVTPKSELEQSRLAVERGAAEVRRSAEAAAELRARRDKYLVRAPLSGYVLSRPVDPGQVVAAGTVLFEVADLRETRIEAEIDEQYLAELKEGMEATVAPIDGRLGPYEARVSYLARRVDPQSGAALARFQIEGVAPEFPAGLSFDVNVPVARHAGAVTVPRVAVAGLGSQPWVLTLEGGRTVRREVRVIDWPAERIVVLAGLAAGEAVLLAPESVPPGTRVREAPAPVGARGR